MKSKRKKGMQIFLYKTENYEEFCICDETTCSPVLQNHFCEILKSYKENYES
jgi:hypothetical protein